MEREIMITKKLTLSFATALAALICQVLAIRLHVWSQQELVRPASAAARLGFTALLLPSPAC